VEAQLFVSTGYEKKDAENAAAQDFVSTEDRRIIAKNVAANFSS
jgi:hypothetical protein